MEISRHVLPGPPESSHLYSQKIASILSLSFFFVEQAVAFVGKCCILLPSPSEKACRNFRVDSKPTLRKRSTLTKCQSILPMVISFAFSFQLSPKFWPHIMTSRFAGRAALSVRPPDTGVLTGIKCVSNTLSGAQTNCESSVTVYIADVKFHRKVLGVCLISIQLLRSRHTDGAFV